MGDWWIDEQPWPGPKEQAPTSLGDFARAFRSIGMTYSRAFGKFAAQLSAYSDHNRESLEELLKDFKPKPPSVPFIPPTPEELIKRKQQARHGPYGGGFDRRGRKF